MQPLWQLQRKYRISTKEKKREFKHATTKKKKKKTIQAQMEIVMQEMIDKKLQGIYKTNNIVP